MYFNDIFQTHSSLVGGQVSIMGYNDWCSADVAACAMQIISRITMLGGG